MKSVHIFLLVLMAAALPAMQQVTPAVAGGAGGTMYFEDNQALVRSRIISESNDRIMSIIRETYENRQRAMDRINRNWDNYIRGTYGEHSRKCR